MRRRIDPFIRGTAAPVAYPPMDTGDGGRRYFADVEFPASRDDIWTSAIEHGAPAPIVEAIRHLPPKVYGQAVDVPNLYEVAERYQASRSGQE